MHLHLLDIPKPRRSRRMDGTSLSLLAVLGIAAPALWILNSRPQVRCECEVVSPVPEPIPMVKVLGWKWEGTGGCRGFLAPYTELKPLTELYDELCEMQDKAIRTLPLCSFIPADAQQTVLLRAEKEFREKYMLKPEQVTIIKREGQRLKQEAGEIATR